MLLTVNYIQQRQLKNHRVDYILAITGSGELFNDWKKYIPLNYLGNNNYNIDLDTDKIQEYKYVLINPTNEYWYWEEGNNRTIQDKIFVEQKDESPVFQLDNYKIAGVAIPVFSLRSQKSYGVGDFNDLKEFIDWASCVGMKIIQILPINDTTMSKTWQDSYPYNANSSFAIHPQYLSLDQLGIRLTKEEEKIKNEINEKQFLDYESVNQLKSQIYNRYYSEIDIKNHKDFQNFLTENKDWLYPYAVYSVLRDDNNTSDFTKWDVSYSDAIIKKYVKTRSKAVNYYCFLQYLLFTQLKETVEYAHCKDVSLKGDLPIGISRTSADAWQNPILYNMRSCAGAPPDDFARNGQNWGFPTYNWENMAKDHYAWWKSRLSVMEQFFDAYRIDHILGFFRIWEIPLKAKSALMGYFNPSSGYFKEDLEKMGFEIKQTNTENKLFIKYPYQKDIYVPKIEGYKTKAFQQLSTKCKDAYNTLYEDFFYKRNNKLWEKGGKVKLENLLEASKMLACGEDLGMIPACVPTTIKELKILSLEIERMPKAWGCTFGNISSYPYLSVASTGTHDTSTLREWWKEDEIKTQQYYNSVLNQKGKAPKELSCELAKQIINNHLQSPSMMCIIPLQDYLSISDKLRYKGEVSNERINNPAISNFYWRYRMHINISELFEDEFMSNIKTMIKASNR